MNRREVSIFLLLVSAVFLLVGWFGAGYNKVAGVSPVATDAIGAEHSPQPLSEPIELAEVVENTAHVVAPKQIGFSELQFSVVTPTPFPPSTWEVKQAGIVSFEVLDKHTFPWEVDYLINNDKYVCGSSYNANDMYCTGGGCPSFSCTKAGYIAIRYSDGWTCCQVPGTNKYCQSSYVYQTTWGTCEYRSGTDTE